MARAATRYAGITGLTGITVFTAAAALVSVPCLSGRCRTAVAEEGPAGMAAGTTYRFGASEARTTVLFESETDLETIHGVTHTMSGTAVLDFERGTGTAELTVPVKSLQTGIEARDGHLRSDTWLDEAKFPSIVFKAKKIAKRASGDVWDYEGTIAIHGVTKDLKGEAAVKRIAEEVGRKLGPGEWVKVKTAFQVTISEFGIEVPDERVKAKVSPIWDVKVDIFGTTAPPKEK